MQVGVEKQLRVKEGNMLTAPKPHQPMERAAFGSSIRSNMLSTAPKLSEPMEWAAFGKSILLAAASGVLYEGDGSDESASTAQTPAGMPLVAQPCSWKPMTLIN